MKIVKIILISFLALFFLLLGISFLLPSKTHVERSMVIAAHPHQIFPLINQFDKWVKWSPWHKKDTTAQYTYNDIAAGVGASYSWKSAHPEVGNGEMKIIETSADTFLKTQMNMEGMGISYSTFKLSETDAGTMVTWSMDADGEGMPIYFVPVAKYFNLFMDRILGAEFEEGLTLLQGIIAQLPHYHIGPYEAEIREFGGMKFVGIREKIAGDLLSQKISNQFASLENLFKQANKMPVGVPFTINHFARNNVFDVTTAMGMPEPMQVSEPIFIKELPASKWMVVKYTGGYSGLSALYQQGFEMLAAENLKPSGAPLEFYLTNPSMEPDSNKWVTELVFPFIE
jgi:effector-binding domain-containing protein